MLCNYAFSDHSKKKKKMFFPSPLHCFEKVCKSSVNKLYLTHYGFLPAKQILNTQHLEYFAKK